MSTIESLELEIESNAQSAASGIDDLTQSLNRLRGVTSGKLGLSAVANELNNIPSAGKKTSASFTDLYHKVSLLGKALTKGGKSIWSAVTKSMDYTENVNLFRVSMGEYAESAMADAEKFSEALGIDTSDWIRAQGVFMTMATGFGVAGDRAATMSKNLTQLGYDLASFYNMDVGDAMTKLKSGLAGELEPLRAIGYDLSQAKLEATAMELGITKSVSAMTQAEKAQLRYYAIMTQVTQVHGDMARTLEDPANQVRVFKAQLSMAAREIGNVFIPALNAILPYAIALTKIIGSLANSIAGLFGFKEKGLEDTTSKVVENTDSVTENLKDSQEQAKKLKSYMLGFDELNIINPNTEDTEDTSGMFEFELPEYDFLEGMAESRVNTIVGDMKEWLGITGEIDSWADLFNTKLGYILISAGAIAGVLLTWRVTEGLTSTIKAISKLSKLGSVSLGIALVITGITIGALAIESALTEGLNGVNAATLVVASVPFIAGGALIGKAFGSAIIGAAIGAIIAGVAGLGVGLYDAIKNELNIANGLLITFSTALIGVGIAALIPAVTTGFGAIIGAIIGAAVVGATWLFKHTESTLAKIGAVVSGAALAVGAILAFTGNLPLGIALMSVGAISMGSAIALNTNKLSDEVKNVIAVITGVVSAAMLVLGAVLTFTGINIPLGIALLAGGAMTLATAVIPNWHKIVDSLSGTVGEIVTVVSSALIAIGALLLLSGVGIPLGLALLATGAVGLVTMVAVNWHAVGDTLKTALSTIAAIVSGFMVVIGVLLLLSGAGIGLGLALIFGGLVGTVGAWKLDNNPITRFMKNMLNSVIQVVNEIIGLINDVVSTFSFGLIKIPLIPLMADGGFPEQGQMFIAREAGAEMVGNIGRKTAVANNDQIVSGIAGGVAEANEEQNALLREQNSLLRSILEKDNSTYLDGRRLTESVEKHQRERGRVIMGGVM